MTAEQAVTASESRSHQVRSPLDEIERQRRHLWTTAFITLVVFSLVVVVMSYWTDVVPDALRDFLDFPGYRFVFLLLSIAFIAYATSRERIFRALTQRFVDEQRRALELEATLTEERAEHEKLVETERVRADFVASITHELKTPLTSLMGYASILRKRGEGLTLAQREEFLGILEKQGQRILQLIEELLQKSRIESGSTKLQRVRLPLQTIVTQVAREIAGGRNRRIDVNAPEGELGLYGDPAAIEHVITNLIDNALKYSPDDTPVNIDVEQVDGEVQVRVRDQGSGIASEDLPFIFDRFRQSQNARGSASVGLGLYIVKNLVTAHGGRVWADSNAGKGTTFTVSLPLRRG